MVDMNQWETGARARLASADLPDDHQLHRRDWTEGWTAAGLWLDDLIGTGRWNKRLTALWLEYRADELDADAAETKDYEAEERMVDEAEAHRTSARAIRRELLGEAEGG